MSESKSVTALNEVVTVEVLGVPIHCFDSIETMLSTILCEAGVVQPGFAIAINPEKIIKSNESIEVKNILLSGTIRYADGIGVVKALQKKTRKKLDRIPGVELWESLLSNTAPYRTRVYILGAEKHVSELVCTKLKSRGVNVVGSHSGYFSDEDALINEIKNSKAKIITVALGSPRQEIFIQKCREQYPDAFYMGVGGTYDVYVGNVKRAPKAWRKANLEWLYRVLSQPSRWKRQVPLLKFLMRYLFNRL
ncbi:WecB/TagA/CpsF family glycosyltransferase [Flocculibacter collagenilyticus]|uniref:WecB/TagA/CpsF family glycosyltransferase n=1 Tax=Flocculibacter collagenilyticus TaxID=2744479 RepID=UPI0018F2A54B|nr:WecB/TagA/CpsF family glycosyltransferase [Flocculibacter collagenilyticus]